MMKKITITNEFKGDRLTTLNLNHIRIVYINIIGLDIGIGDHFLLKLCQTLQEKGVDIVYITETNVYWEISHIYHHFKKMLHDT